MAKRSVEFRDEAIVADKRPRSKDEQVLSASNSIAIQAKKHSMKGPITLLSGHDGEILASKFHPSGLIVASAGVDRSVLLWSTKNDCDNYSSIKAAHSHTITDLQFSITGDQLFTCSADKIVMVWDSITGTRLKKLRAHNSYVNSLSTAPSNPHILASVGDDASVIIWDLRSRRLSMSIKEKYQLTAVALNVTGDQVIVGGIANTINVWDLRRSSIDYSLVGHTDTVTGLSLSPDGKKLLSNAMDKSLRSWDIRKSAPGNKRLEKVFFGHQHNHEKNLLRCAWSPLQNMVTAGSSDGIIHIWNYSTYEKIHELTGHKWSVNDVAFSPKEQLMLSCGSDKQIFLREIDYDVV